jgi:hypothetical protein
MAQTGSSTLVFQQWLHPAHDRSGRSEGRFVGRRISGGAGVDSPRSGSRFPLDCGASETRKGGNTWLVEPCLSATAVARKSARTKAQHCVSHLRMRAADRRLRTFAIAVPARCRVAPPPAGAAGQSLLRSSEAFCGRRFVRKDERRPACRSSEQRARFAAQSLVAQTGNVLAAVYDGSNGPEPARGARECGQSRASA